MANDPEELDERDADSTEEVDTDDDQVLLAPEESVGSFQEGELGRKVDDKERSGESVTDKIQRARDIASKAERAERAIGTAAKTARGAAAAGQAAGVAGGAAAAAEGTAVAVGSTAAVATAPEWVPVVLIIIAAVIGIILIVGIILLIAAAFGGTINSGEGGSVHVKAMSLQNADHVALMQDVSALADALNNTDGVTALRKEVSGKLLKRLKELQANLAKDLPNEKFRTPAAEKLKKMITDAEDLIAALDQASKANADQAATGQNAVKNNQLKLSPELTAKRDGLVKDLKELKKIYVDAGGSLNDRVAQLALSRARSGAFSPTVDNWCAEFASAVYRDAGYTNFQPVNPNFVPNIWEYMEKNHIAFLAGDATPRPGDLAFIDTGYSGVHDGLDHIGIVIEVFGNGTRVKTAEGNLGGNFAVEIRDIGTGVSDVHRFGRMRN